MQLAGVPPAHPQREPWALLSVLRDQPNPVGHLMAMGLLPVPLLAGA